MLMQAYDFHELYNRFGCTLQLGGSDQWGNIVNGVELCRRKDGAEVFGLTTPLLATSSGRKMGKTEGGAVWLNADMFSPYDYWQYWRNTDDADVGLMLARFTTMPMAEVRRLAALGGSEINEAKKVLANEATALLHGRQKADEAENTAKEAFAKTGSGNLSIEGRVVLVSAAALSAGLPLLETFQQGKLISSKGEGRRHISAGALRINDVPLTEERALTTADVVNGIIKLSIGKKTHAVVRVA
jgi:tyrosyl-tRNA synthetase